MDSTPTIPTPCTRWILRLAALAFLALGGAVLAHFSMATHPRFLQLPSAVDSQMAILERRIFVFEGIEVDYPSWRNRVAVPLAMSAVMAVTPATPSQAYLLVRWLGGCALIAAFAWLVRVATGAAPGLCGLAALGFGLCLFPTFLHIYEVPSDFFDAALFSLLVGLALQRRRALFVVVLLPALLNRESAVFALGVWWAVHAWPFVARNFWRESAFCAATWTTAAALVVALRRANALDGPSVPSGLQPFTFEMFAIHGRQLRDFFFLPSYGHPFFFLFGYLILLGLITLACGRELPATLRRLGCAGLALYVPSVVFGNLDELRISIPSLVISSLLLVWLAFPRPRPAASP